MIINKKLQIPLNVANKIVLVVFIINLDFVKNFFGILGFGKFISKLKISLFAKLLNCINFYYFHL
ncbi:hypothetical protein DERP_004209 [Dermatophagoides pteronyssinus]|uniref:Uncharacterized protein n=1 Tax=Dermatophagoides pteronyssinus TaxID=6956 RepID=A0ABQ8J8H5_DERPT|nr:hypothetical protein DERP_004209 [Dermatophagoides pteronyssinus]